MGINDKGIKTMRDIYSFARMLLRCLPVLLFILPDTLAQYAAPLTDTLKWKNIASRYKNFVEVRPILVNDGKESIFLSRIWPHGSAQLQRVPSPGWRIREIPDCAYLPKTHPQTVRALKTSRTCTSKTRHNRRFSAQKST